MRALGWVTYRSTHDLVGNQGTSALESANIMVRQVLHDLEADFANGQGSGNRYVLVRIRVSGLEVEALLAFGKRSCAEKSSSIVLMRVENIRLFSLGGILRITRRARLLLKVGPLQAHALLVARPHAYLGLLESSLPKVVKRLLVVYVVLGVRDACLLESEDSSQVSATVGGNGVLRGVQLLPLGVGKPPIRLSATILVGTTVGASSVHVAVDVRTVLLEVEGSGFSHSLIDQKRNWRKNGEHDDGGQRVEVRGWRSEGGGCEYTYSSVTYLVMPVIKQWW